ncbi:hypothetical protein [Methyloversatilis discipulorum]|uniref:hypothetical protein n=1 Tax=Methyloversatilis discipulorum TaxID=1119528 RepID=UPI003AF98819
MNFEILQIIGELLRDSSVPEHRVVRKATALSVLLIAILVFYRHFELGFGFGEPLLITLGLAFITFFVLGIFGGVLAGGFYKAFLSAVDAKRSEPSVATFFAEWLFAALAPAMGLVAFGYLNNADQWAR